MEAREFENFPVRPDMSIYQHFLTRGRDVR